MELDKIYLGDAYELIKGIPDKSIDCIITDPPYEFSGNKKWFGKADKYLSGNVRGVADLVNDENLTQGIRTEMLDEWCRVMKQINIFIFCNKWQMFDYLKYFQKDRGCNFEILVWAKTNPMPLANNAYVHDKEFCLNFWEKGAKRGKCTGFDLLKTVYNLPINQKDKREFEHQTCKPLAMVENLVEIGTQEGGGYLGYFYGERDNRSRLREQEPPLLGL